MLFENRFISLPKSKFQHAKIFALGCTAPTFWPLLQVLSPQANTGRQTHVAHSDPMSDDQALGCEPTLQPGVLVTILWVGDKDFRLFISIQIL